MKKLLLILLCLPLLFGCGREAKTIETDKEKKDVQFVVSDDFIPVDNETYINAFMESASLLNLSEKEQVDLINRNRKMIEMYAKMGAEDMSENMVIKKTESIASQKELNYLVEQLKEKGGRADEISPVEVELISSGNKKYKNKYNYFEIVSKIDASEQIINSRYNAMYSIDISNNYYQIFLNTNIRTDIDDVIVNILIQ